MRPNTTFATLKTSVLMALVMNLGFAQSIPSEHAYLGQALPGPSPKKFELATSSGFFAAERICISNDGKEIYYSELNGYQIGNKGRTKYYKFVDRAWTGPFLLFEELAAPILSPAGDKMYLEKNFDTYCSERTPTGWAEPKLLRKDAHYFQQIANGTFYLATSNAEGRIGRSDWSVVGTEGGQSIVRSLGSPLNSTGKNLDFFMAKDASYFIFAQFADSLFISYKKADNTWTKPKALISMPGNYLWGPNVVDGGKYLFFTGGASPTNTCTYWVKIDGEIEKLRHTNFQPYVKNKMASQTVSSGKTWTFTIPEGTFLDDDGNQTLTYSASLKNGSPLPSWLKFNPATRTFFGTPPEAGVLSLKITATDTAKTAASCDFDIGIDRPVQAEKPVVTQPSDIPDHDYVIPCKPSEALQKRDALLALILQMEKDKKEDLEKYEIQDPASLKSLHSTLHQLALLKQDYPAARRHLEQLRSLQVKPLHKLMTGLIAEPYMQAREKPGADFQASFRAILTKALAALPFQEVQGNLKAMRDGMKAASKAQVIGNTEKGLDPMVREGKLSEEMAIGLLGQAMTLDVMIPVKEEIVAAIEGYFEANTPAPAANKG